MQKIEFTMPKLPFAAEEAMNRLRVNVKFSGAEIKKILITSSVPNEGKSVVSVQLWKLMADAGFKTVFVDADLRKSVLKGRLAAKFPENAQGLDYYLSGLASYEEVIYETNVENGYFVPCTNLLENPSNLLEDPKLKELFDRLTADFDYIIVDSAPLMEVSDGMTIGTLCDGALLIVRAGETPKGLIRTSMQYLERANCKLLGTVLNGAGKGQGGYYGKHKYGYKYGYGSKYGAYKYGYGYGYGDKEEKTSEKAAGKASDKSKK